MTDVPDSPPAPRWTLGRILLRVVHWPIIANFVFQVGYAGYMVFAVVKPEHTEGPLFAAALTMPFELMVTRRLYASEFWVAFSGLAIYLALTEIGPRMWRLPQR